MKTVGQILKEKGYDNDQIVTILYEHPNLDEKVRDEFEINEPIHLWECYYIGDANPEEMDRIAQEKGYEDYTELFKAMDKSLTDLAESCPSKI